MTHDTFSSNWKKNIFDLGRITMMSGRHFCTLLKCILHILKEIRECERFNLSGRCHNSGWTHSPPEMMAFLVLLSRFLLGHKKSRGAGVAQW